MSELLNDLQFRGLVNQVTDEDGLAKVLEEDKIKLYSGFDPTADSLHIGHLLPVLTLKRFQLNGHHPIALVGGATGLIGDPSGKKAERTLNTADIVQDWSDRIKGQLSRFLDFEADVNPAVIVNNYDWIGSLDVISFLRDVGKNFGINYMLAKDSVKTRIESGISFTEFSYMILQSFDFLKLYEQNECKLQIGGSDQWGNITAGLELIRKSEENSKAYGLTIPLVTKADGTKFGKTEGGAIWLDREKTSPYEFYQFWINTDDRDVVKYLKYFTFLSQTEIEQFEEEIKNAPEKRLAQKALAEEVTKLVHGEEALQQAIKISAALFSGDIKQLTGNEILEGFKDVPSTKIEEAEIGLVDLLIQAKIAPSKRQAREDITNGAIYINGDRIQELSKVISDEDKIDGQFTVIRRGKKKYFLIRYA
ncbi:tyrosine--tRNA ligase [Metabacillus bambusae]|uniref:Tyrosine--tRNA ligase n=1 Tax=Metabacillus bambusae TaxID=2795218 RepID=A0ABS3N561_9BACI|nr:tyrosine--tRNA ligase [Metabacillus bambusae]MBO1513221.1 tyrosine--tRNA ligase [Metabacillus bambusae]